MDRRIAAKETCHCEGVLESPALGITDKMLAQAPTPAPC